MITVVDLWLQDRRRPSVGAVPLTLGSLWLRVCTLVFKKKAANEYLTYGGRKICHGIFYSQSREECALLFWGIWKPRRWENRNRFCVLGRMRDLDRD